MAKKPNQVTTEQKRILILSAGLTNYIVGQIQLGVRQFTLNRPEWQMGYLNVRNTSLADIREALAWNPDGILVLERPSLVPIVLEVSDTPMALVDLYHEHPEKISRVEIDDKGIGANAARYFLKNRFEHFAVVTCPGEPGFSSYRAQGFIDELRKNGHTPAQFEVNYVSEQPWHENPELDSWLKQLPKPTAVYSVQDLVAQRIIERSKRLDIRIPTELSVVGTDNSQNICEANRPFISSMPQPLELAGFEVASLLEELMNQHVPGKELPVLKRQIEPGDVVERQSSSLRAVPDEIIATAANYLRTHIILGGTIPDAAREAGVNRRTLERGFRKYLGSTPGEYVREIKIDHAKKLLAETDLRMWEVAQSCKMTQEHFTTFFREETGMTPSAYRRTRKRNAAI